MKIVTGDLFDSKEQHIVHQCNCITTRAAHLAYHMFRHFPHANIYAERNSLARYDPPPEGLPGNIVVRGDGKEKRLVIAILGQFYPGRPRWPNSNKDGTKARQRYFKEGLEKVVKIEGLESIAFPWQIGCGAAGGDWGKYQNMIEEAFKDSAVQPICYRLPGM